MYTTNLMNIKNVTGDQLGAYFGYCVAASDLNGDGLDDLIIGAPMYTNYANTEGKYETGRVYIAYQKRRDSFQKITLLDGDVTKARFGLAVTKLGDINLDEYNDIAVGAPYGGPNGGGAVYIFHGSAEGIKTKATQVQYIIYSLDLVVSNSKLHLLVNRCWYCNLIRSNFLLALGGVDEILRTSLSVFL